MLKIIVVEDEDIIREGIVSSIEQEGESGLFEVVAQAGDGEEALDAIEEHRPDIVVTDIKMPFMDGITLLEKIKPKYQDMFVVILSGHDEFEYARRALKAGAYDFLLKPVKIKNLLEVLDNIRMEIEEKRQRKEELLQLKQIEKNSISRRRDEYLRELLLGRERYGANSEKAALLSDASCYMVGIVGIENVALLTQGCDYLQLMELDQHFEQAVYAAAARYTEWTVLKENLCECIVCARAREAEVLKRAAASFREEVRSAAPDDIKLRVTFGKLCDMPQKLHDSYVQAVRARERGSLNFDDFVNGLNADEHIRYMDFDDTELLSAIRVGNRRQIENELKNLAEQMMEQKVVSQLHMIMVASRIYFDVSKLLTEVSYNTEEAMAGDAEHFNLIISQNRPEAIVDKLKNYCYKVADFLEEVHSGKFAKVLIRAKEFIKNNFMNENLMLEDVAQQAYISASYMCIIFKKEAGETFIEYLTKVRMEHAARLLLETDMRNYEIAEACGYSNPAYFSTIFKKYYNMPPSMYKAQKKRQV